jgi:metal-dependent amidase/aminoacylase/carboxypeptidase family protein
VVEPSVREVILKHIEEMTHLIAQAHRCEGEFQLDVLSSIIINDEKLTLNASEAAALADIQVAQVPAQMVGDDFSEYSPIAPGCYVLLGVQSEDSEYYPLHHGKFCLNEKGLIHGVAWFCALALKE